MASAIAQPRTELSLAVPPRPWLAAGTLCQRELVRFFRQRNRVIGAVGQPVIFWVLFGAGLGPSFRMPGSPAGDVTYFQYFFPGTLVLILLFTAIFTTISIIEDRHEGFLQSVLVAPIPRWSMVLGKIAGGTAIAMLQGLVFLALGLTLSVHFTFLSVLLMVVFCTLVAFALTGLGFVMAWRLDSAQGFHAMMSVVLFPMWLLSGAFFPAASGPLKWIMLINPLSYGVAGVRRLLYWDAPAAIPAGLPSLAICWAVTLAFAGLTFWASWKIAAQRTSGDLL